MDKEEAIKILKDFHDESAIFSVRTALETLHPELAESEDEKTRKSLIHLVHLYGGEFGMIDANTTVEKAIAWLENIPYTIDHEKREGFHLGYKAGLEKQGETFTKKDVDDAYLKNISDAKNELEKQGEQKSWSEEDEKMINAAISFIEHSPFTTIGKGKKNTISWLKSLKQRIGGKL